MKPQTTHFHCHQISPKALKLVQVAAVKSKLQVLVVSPKYNDVLHIHIMYNNYVHIYMHEV